ncbi:hypothetical protein EV215_1337 [Hypnocyclicus thermotrophus]|uniref:Uncharacterized protein n=1 Tax=Hypnocyclicus thermotrophus TaxID=1627895 RepID=A0AA46DYK2_9FUSO|nr:hypothetical protein [Hypnocyclicus thermotrophus]TDT69797.1 hypothetical protein EV215_1337 [Hypnocyclicus thermotrophus]
MYNRKNNIQNKFFTKYFLIIIILLFFVKTNIFIENREKEIFKDKSVKEKNYDVFLYKIFGIKKAATSLLWIKQSLEIGTPFNNSVEIETKKIYETSLKIAELSPYFLQNYYISSSILAFINRYKKYNMASSILVKGVEYNKENELLRKYLIVIGGLKGNNFDKVERVINEILNERYDIELIKYLIKVYEMRYKDNSSKILLSKIERYLKIILKYGNSKDKEYAIRKIYEYKTVYKIKK